MSKRVSRKALVLASKRFGYAFVDVSLTQFFTDWHLFDATDSPEVKGLYDDWFEIDLEHVKGFQEFGDGDLVYSGIYSCGPMVVTGCELRLVRRPDGPAYLTRYFLLSLTTGDTTYGYEGELLYANDHWCWEQNNGSGCRWSNDRECGRGPGWEFSEDSEVSDVPDDVRVVPTFPTERKHSVVAQAWFDCMEEDEFFTKENTP